MRKLFSAILIIAVLGFGKTAKNASYNRAFEIKVHNINQVELSISNFGKFGQNENSEAGCWWPKGSGDNYIFGAGPWFGTIANGVDTLVTIGYGPHGAETEFGPGLTGWVTSDPQAVIFMYPENWASIDYAQLPMAPKTTRSHQDSWCCYNDADETWHVPGDTKPIGIEVYQTVYAWNLSTTDDIVFVKYELKNVSPAKLEKCFFGVCTDNDIGNESGTGNDIISGKVGQWYVIDGESLWVDNLGYQWQEVEEAGFDQFPGAIGFDFLQSPWALEQGQDIDNDGIPDDKEMDSTYYQQNLPDSMWDADQDGTMDWEDPSQIPQVGMTAFKRFTLNLEPNKDNERYVTLAGYNFKTMAYEPLDTVPPDPDDQRFVQVSGPFELDTNETAVVLVGIMFAEWHGIYLKPDTALVQVDNMCQFIYDMNWLLPGPPPSPMLTCVPGDKKVTLIWDNSSEIYADPYYKIVHFAPPGSAIWDPYYKEYDFEGFQIWKSFTGNSGTWTKLATNDIINDVEYTYVVAEGDTLVADNSGLVHSFVDDDVRNGFTYYYAVTAFDYNRVKGTFDSIFVADSVLMPDSEWIYDYDTIKVMGSSPVYFQSGLAGVPAVPRRDPANFVSGSWGLTSVVGNPLLPDSSIDGAMTEPMSMKADPFYLEFGPVNWDSETVITDTLRKLVYSPIYSTSIKNSNNEVVYSHSFTLKRITSGTVEGLYEFPSFQGLTLNATFKSVYTGVSDASIFDSIIRVSGTYPDTMLLPKKNPSNWAYRGNDYEIHWIKAHGSDSVNSVIVIDAMSLDTIPYRASKSDTLVNRDSLFNGWCFEGSGSATIPVNSDTLIFVNATGTRYLYINGGWFGLKKAAALRPGDPRPSLNDVWIAHANPIYPPASINARIQVNSVPASFLGDTTLTLNVKVVPNPYIITNEWQQSFRLRRLRFINLPNKCTIRVFNINGELIKTILHTETIISEGSNVQNNIGGDEWWDLLSENRQLVASGIYVYHVQSEVGEQVGKFVVVR